MNNQDKIKEAEHIRTMLQAEKINHDEVNARVWCLTKDGIFKELAPSWCGFIIVGSKGEHYDWCPKYTTSLDACASLMLDGWEWYGSSNLKIDMYSVGLHKGNMEEELLGENNFSIIVAWLDAILQSMIWEWSNGDE